MLFSIDVRLDLGLKEKNYVIPVDYNCLIVICVSIIKKHSYFIIKMVDGATYTQ